MAHVRKYHTLIYCFLQLIHLSLCIDYDGWLNIKIEHSLDCKSDKFCSRGNISLKSLRSGSSTIDQIPFNNKHIKALQALAEADGFYSIRTLVTSADNTETEFLSSLKARSFLDNGLSDVINAWVLPSGAVMAISFQATNSTQPLKLQKQDEYVVNSNFYLHHVEQAPVPDTASYIQKIEREREARDTGETKDNRSFLAKYWMYIVPIAIFVMISGATNPDGGAPAGR